MSLSFILEGREISIQMNQKPEKPSSEAIRDLLTEIEPGSSLSVIRSMRDDMGNTAFLVEAQSAAGSPFRIVIKQYTNYGGDYHRKKARLEFETLKLLQNHRVPAPKPLYMDVAGDHLGAPTLITSFVPGETILSASEPLEAARELAIMLAKIHSIPVDEAAKAFLLEANTETLWFMKTGNIPDYMVAHPDGPAVWQAVIELLPQCRPVPPALIHIDYWMGNMIWHEGRIAAVIDWEEAAYGDPAIDVAYCRMDMFLSKMGRQAADEFLAVYEAETGRQVANLALWEFAAAPRPMHDPAWEAEVRPELRDFIANVKRSVGE